MLVESTLTMSCLLSLTHSQTHMYPKMHSDVFQQATGQVIRYKCTVITHL